MNSELWRSSEVSIVEFLKYDGKFVGTRTKMINGYTYTNALFPDVQEYVANQPGFAAMMQERKIVCRDVHIGELEYQEVYNQSKDVEIVLI